MSFIIISGYMIIKSCADDFYQQLKEELQIRLSFINLIIMKKIFVILLASAAFTACNNHSNTEEAAVTTETGTAAQGQSAVQDNESQKDVVKVAVASPDHTTLVAALKAAEYVDVLSNAGPFTVFAPTNAAFAKLPAGTVEGLVKPEKKNDLRNILEYHVTTSSLKEEWLKDGMTIGMVNGGSVKVTKSADGEIKINDANVLAVAPASNGVVYVIDAVLLPK